jgi:hypothetical protein
MRPCRSSGGKPGLKEGRVSRRAAGLPANLSAEVRTEAEAKGEGGRSLRRGIFNAEGGRGVRRREKQFSFLLCELRASAREQSGRLGVSGKGVYRAEPLRSLREGIFLSYSADSQS